MKLENKKSLAARTLNVGKGRITFNTERLSEIKEAITKQDIRDLLASGAIYIKVIKGRRKTEKRKNRRGMGKVKMKVNRKKQAYVQLTRKLRLHISELRNREKISEENYQKLRVEIKSKTFKDKLHMKERIKTLWKA